MSWKGVKKQVNKVEIETWCEEMGIRNYIINSKGEIDVNGYVDLSKTEFEELPYKFGKVKSFFDINGNQNLISLKNCPDYIKHMFDIDGCTKLDSLEGCPKEVNGSFYCRRCKRKFTKKEIMSLCKVNENIIN